MSMHNPAHPGEILKELIITPLDITITEVAEHLNVNRKTLSKILNGRGAITSEMALRLELVFKKPSADHWLRLQNACDLWHSRQNQSDLHVVPCGSNFNDRIIDEHIVPVGGNRLRPAAMTGQKTRCTKNKPQI